MHRVLTPLSLLTTLVILAGCESAQYGSDLSATPRPRPIESADRATFKLPDEAPFNITLPETREQPLLNGKSDATCVADKRGTAQATAAVQNGGIGEALFRVGHSIQNTTGQELSLTCRVGYAIELDVKTSTATAASDAVVGLRLYARDATGRLLRTVPLVDYTSADGDVHRTGRDEVTIDVTFSPGNTVNLFVAGQARVDVPEERTASATIALNELKMEIAKK